MTNYKKLQENLCKLGMDKKWSGTFVKKLATDEENSEIAWEKKLWAIKHGFFPGRIDLYGLNEENVSLFVPDFNYFMVHPLNHHFRIWVNDKLTLKYILNNSDFSSVMPEYYLYVENDGSYTYLMDCPNDIEKNSEFLWNLLCKKKVLAIKPNSGTFGGVGFIKLEFKDGNIFENNNVISKERFVEIQSMMQNYIVTEYVHQHRSLAEIWPDSECTLRIIMCKGAKKMPGGEDDWFCSVSYARFGTKASAGASNLSSGGVGVGFNYETGLLDDYSIRFKEFCLKDESEWKSDKHPDTEIKWRKRQLPNWNFVKDTVQKICKYISSLSYLGFDVIITESGMKICEINTHPGLDYEQIMCGPALQKNNVKAYFRTKGMFSFNGEDFLKAYLDAQI